MRVICWFSAGAASAVATKLALNKYGKRVVIYYCDTGAEHPDNYRFISDCERYFGHPIKTLKSEKYADTWDVWKKTRYLVGPYGARCTTELKKVLRVALQEPDDLHIFGYDATEKGRYENFKKNNFDLNVEAPLIDKKIDKGSCLALLRSAGIEIPVMYQMGYKNNNCIGCPKGGAGYWNKIRKDFPDVFLRMSKLERRLGVSILRERREGKAAKLYLDELGPERGNYSQEPGLACGFMCGSDEFAPAPELSLKEFNRVKMRVGAYEVHAKRRKETRSAIEKVVEQLYRRGERVTKSEVSRLTGFSRENISKRYSNLF